MLWPQLMARHGSFFYLSIHNNHAELNKIAFNLTWTLQWVVTKKKKLFKVCLSRWTREGYEWEGRDWEFALARRMEMQERTEGSMSLPVLPHSQFSILPIIFILPLLCNWMGWLSSLTKKLDGWVTIHPFSSPSFHFTQFILHPIHFFS